MCKKVNRRPRRIHEAYCREGASPGLKATACLAMGALVLTMMAAATTADHPLSAQAEPADEHHVWNGLVGCSLNYPTAFQPWTCPHDENDTQHTFTVEPGLKTLRVAMNWQPTDLCTSEDLRHWLYAPADANFATLRFEESSPIEYRLDAGDGLPAITETTEFRFQVWGPAQGAQLCLEQPFTVEYELFYSDHAEETPAKWPSLEQASIRPGVNIAGGCTANFVFSSLDQEKLYIGTASHCVSGDLGSSVSIAGIAGAGTIAYCSFMHVHNEVRCPSTAQVSTNAGEIGFNDFALIEIQEEHHDKVHPAVLHWGGPVALADPPGIGSKIEIYGNSPSKGNLEGLKRIEGYVTRSLEWRTGIYTVPPGIPGDSGSATLTADGEAVGAFVAIGIAGVTLFPGEGVVTNLARALEYMEDETGLQVELETWPRLNPGLLPDP